MKYLNKLRKLNKSTKISLISSAVYATTTLAIPAFANTDAVQPVNVDQITTVEQAETAYKEKLTEYAEDKKINLQEIENLYSIVKKGRNLERESEHDVEKTIEEQRKKVDEQRDKLRQEIYRQKHDLDQKLSDIHSKKKQLLTPVEALEEKISQEYSELYKLEKQAEQEKVFLTYETELNRIRKQVDNLIAIYYPGLIKETKTNYNVDYDVKEQLVEPVIEELGTLMEKADKIFQAVYRKDSIEFLRWKTLTIHSLIIFRELINTKQEVEYTPKDYNALKQNKTLSIQQLTQKKVLMEQENSPKLAALEEQRKMIVKKIDTIYDTDTQNMLIEDMLPYPVVEIVQTDFSVRQNLFKNYFEAVTKREDFIKKYCDASKYWINSMILDEHDLKGKKNKPEYDFKTQVSDLEQLLNSQEFQLNGKTFKVRVADIKNPSRVKFPLGLAWVGGIAIMYLRNLLIGQYIIKREWDAWDLVEPLLIGGISPFLFDGIHPFIYPIRVFGLSFLTEPIRKFARDM